VIAEPIAKANYFEFPVVWRDGDLDLTAHRVLLNIAIPGPQGEPGAVSFPDAPADGKLYARRDGAWVEII
jgi:hypothetical protein